MRKHSLRDLESMLTNTDFQQFGILYYLPLYYQAVQGYSPIIAGVALVGFLKLKQMIIC